MNGTKDRMEGNLICEHLQEYSCNLAAQKKTFWGIRSLVILSLRFGAFTQNKIGNVSTNPTRGSRDPFANHNRDQRFNLMETTGHVGIRMYKWCG